MNLSTVEIKAFVPAHDFEVSKQFYLAVGFTMPWSDDELAYFHAGNASFLLQNFYVEAHAKNFQIHLLVENVDDWHAHVIQQDIAGRFGVKVGDLQDQPWAMREFALFDPSGVLWLIAQNIPERGPA